MQIIVEKLLKNAKFISLILGFFCILETSYSKPIYLYDAPPEAQHYPVLNYTLIELIENLSNSMSTPLNKVQSLFNNQLHLESKNEYFTFYIGGPFITHDGIVINDTDIIIKSNNKKTVKHINLYFDQKQCVITEILKKKFKLYTLIPIFSHPVDHPPIGYGTHLGKISLSVGTTTDNENCATNIEIGRR